jgi:rhodanese domain protein
VKRPIRALVTSALLVSCGALALTGCSGSSDSSASSSAHTTPADAKATGPVVIIDLRSAEEYKQGHLEGAVNYDFSSGDFSSQISGLDRNAQYQVYGTDDQPKMASAVMRNAGFPSVTDLGAIDAAKNTTGAKIVTD